MQQYEVAAAALTERAQAERQYMHYALALAIVLALVGAALIVLGLGDHLDIIVAGSGDMEARFINASPGVVLWLASAAIFWFSKPRRFRATVHHDAAPDVGARYAEFEQNIRDTERRIQLLLAQVEGRVEGLLNFMDSEGIAPRDAPPSQAPTAPQTVPKPTPRVDKGGASFELYQGGEDGNGE